MKGKSYLEPGDKKLFKGYVFGGILGDNPPKGNIYLYIFYLFIFFEFLDRTKCLRDDRFSYRHLGDI